MIPGEANNHERNLAHFKDYLHAPDGEVIILDHVDAPKAKPTDPIIVIVPGICSTSNANYIRCFASMCAEQGLRSVVYIPRGCEELRTPKLFTLGGTDDLRQAIHHLRAQNPEAPMIGVAFSLGANALVKYVGEAGRAGENPILCGAISMAQGYNAVTGIEHLHKVPFYERGLAWRLTRLVQRHQKHFKNNFNVEFLSTVKTVEDFDRHFTCKLLGYDSPSTYYKDHSCATYVTEANIPLFLLNALDDPMVLRDNIPLDAPSQNENVIVITTKYGGHLGWCEGFLFPSLVHWHDKLALDLVGAILKLNKKH